MKPHFNLDLFNFDIYCGELNEFFDIQLCETSNLEIKYLLTKYLLSL